MIYTYKIQALICCVLYLCNKIHKTLRYDNEEETFTQT